MCRSTRPFQNPLGSAPGPPPPKAHEDSTPALSHSSLMGRGTRRPRLGLRGSLHLGLRPTQPQAQITEQARRASARSFRGTQLRAAWSAKTVIRPQQSNRAQPQGKPHTQGTMRRVRLAVHISAGAGKPGDGSDGPVRSPRVECPCPGPAPADPRWDLKATWPCSGGKTQERREPGVGVAVPAGERPWPGTPCSHPLLGASNEGTTITSKKCPPCLLPDLPQATPLPFSPQPDASHTRGPTSPHRFKISQSQRRKCHELNLWIKRQMDHYFFWL